MMNSEQESWDWIELIQKRLFDRNKSLKRFLKAFDWSLKDELHLKTCLSILRGNGRL